MHSRLSVHIAATAAAIVILFSVALYQASQTRIRLIDAIQWESHTNQVSNALIGAEVHIDELQEEARAVRTYRSRNDIALPGYARMQADIANIKFLTSDNPVQQMNIGRRLEPLTSDYFSTIQAGRDASDSFVGIKQTLADMQAEESHLLLKRTARTKATIAAMGITLLCVTLLGMLIVVGSAIVIGRELNRRTQTETELKRAHETIISDHANLALITSFLYNVVHADLDLGNVMRMVAQSAMDLTGAAGAVIGAIDADVIEMRVSVGTNVPPEGAREPAGSTLSGRSVRQGRGLYIHDCDVDIAHDWIAKKYAARSMIAVPLGSEDSGQFSLKVASGQPGKFNEKDLATLELMAGIITTALDRATQHETIRETQSQLAGELSRVADLNVVLEFQRAELERANANLEARATTDGLTGLNNHRAFQERLEEELLHRHRYSSALSVVMLDVDHFKDYNDTYGHPAGDEILKQVANLLLTSVRECDFVARYGGEEFAIILPEASEAAALMVAERCRSALESFSWAQTCVTASFGVAEFMDGTDVLSRADEALYAAKRAGRNRVNISSVEPLCRAV